MRKYLFWYAKAIFGRVSKQTKSSFPSSKWTRKAAFYYDPYGIRTRDTAVKGRCLNRLTKGPKNMAEKEGFEPSHRFRDLYP